MRSGEIGVGQLVPVHAAADAPVEVPLLRVRLGCGLGGEPGVVLLHDLGLHEAGHVVRREGDVQVGGHLEAGHVGGGLGPRVRVAVRPWSGPRRAALAMASSCAEHLAHVLGGTIVGALHQLDSALLVRRPVESSLEILDQFAARDDAAAAFPVGSRSGPGAESGCDADRVVAAARPSPPASSRSGSTTRPLTQWPRGVVSISRPFPAGSRCAWCMRTQVGAALFPRLAGRPSSRGHDHLLIRVHRAVAGLAVDDSSSPSASVSTFSMGNEA